MLRNKNKISGLVHVGANIGQEVPFYLEIINNNIYLFEPLSSAFQILKSKFSSYPNIKLFNFGLGDNNEEKELYVADENHGSSSSLLEPSLHKDYFPEIKFSNIERIKLKKFSELDSIQANLLVIDVQGFELQSLKGFENKLNDFDYIISEISRKSLYKSSVLVDELDIFLKENSFIRYKTSWVSNKPTGDAIYIKINNLSFLFIFLLKLKKIFIDSKVYLFLNFFKNRKKLIYILKSKLKKT